MFNNNHSSLSRITIGSFDGLHAGHQTIIQRLVADAHSHGQKAVLVSFFPTPAVFFKKIKTPYYLTTNSEKVALLQQFGIDQTIILPFDRELAQSDAESFIVNLQKQVLFDTVYIGYDFHFGANREGDGEKLEEFSEKYGFQVYIQKPVDFHASPISSSLIRTYVSEGRVAEIYPLLNRWYSLMGEVIHGDGRGKRIGIPTANITYEPQKLLPPNGIYATRIHIGNEVHPAAASIGFRPTFYTTPTTKTVEASILDWDQDVYGKTVVLEFVRRLRDEIQYENVEKLTAQIQKDIQATREIINNE
ncbi:MAG: bifunctional riboflavin kinase/FAD synthetase [Anaerolineaceae bacterium]